MKEFIFSVLSYLESSVRNGFAHFFSLLLKAHSGVAYILQEKSSQPKSLSAKDRKSYRLDASSLFPSTRSEYNQSVARAVFFLCEPIYVPAKTLTKKGVFLDKIESLRSTVQCVTTVAKVTQSIHMQMNYEIDRHRHRIKD